MEIMKKVTKNLQELIQNLNKSIKKKNLPNEGLQKIYNC